MFQGPMSPCHGQLQAEWVPSTPHEIPQKMAEVFSKPALFLTNKTRRGYLRRGRGADLGNEIPRSLAHGVPAAGGVNHACEIFD